MDYMLEARNVSRGFPMPGGETYMALKGVDLYAPAGKLTILKGRSGSGKTTLLNILSALDEPTGGKIILNGKDITGMSENGIVGAILGAVTATLGLITPSVIVILIVASILKSFRNNKYVNSAFYGLHPASTGLITAAGLGVMMTNLFHAGAISLSSINWKGWLLAIGLWILTNKVKSTKKLHPIVFIALSAVIGIVFSM